MYESNVDYLMSKRMLELEKMLLEENADSIASRYSNFGIESKKITDLINNRTTTSSIAQESAERLMQSPSDLKNLLEKNGEILKGTNLGKENISDIVKNSSKNAEIGNNLEDFLNKSLKSEMANLNSLKESVEKNKRKVEAANKKAILTGKIDIYSQLNNLLK